MGPVAPSWGAQSPAATRLSWRGEEVILQALTAVNSGNTTHSDHPWTLLLALGKMMQLPPRRWWTCSLSSWQEHFVGFLQLQTARLGMGHLRWRATSSSGGCNLPCWINDHWTRALHSPSTKMGWGWGGASVWMPLFWENHVNNNNRKH